MRTRAREYSGNLLPTTVTSVGALHYDWDVVTVVLCCVVVVVVVMIL